jgi:hypothetical protein
MTDSNDKQHRSRLQGIASRAMLEKGFLPDFPLQVRAELDGIHGPATQAQKLTRNLGDLL